MNEIHKPKNAWLSWLGLVAFTFFLVFAWCFAAIWQLVIPAYIPLYAYTLYALLFSLVFLPFTLAGRFRRTKIVFQTMFILASILIWFFPVDTRQPFLRDLSSVQTGMTVAQVDAIMGKYMKGTGWPANPFDSGSSSTETLTEAGNGSTYQTKINKGQMEIADAITYRHSDEAEYNSAWGVVSFKNGRVVKTEFMPD